MKKIFSARIKQWLVFMVFLIMALAGNKLLSQEVPISFRIENVESYCPSNPVVTPWIFDMDDAGFMPGWHDGNPFTFSPNPLYRWHTYAYRDFYSTDPINRPPINPAMPYSSTCLAENLAFVANVNGFRITFEDFTLTAHQHLNMVHPGGNWAVRGQAGDLRIYTGGVGEIYHNDVLVLRAIDCVLKVYVNYPDVAEMRDMGILTWGLDIGNGSGSTVEGWGTIDMDNTLPDWKNTFANAAANNRIDFLMSSTDHVIQSQYGYYSFDLGLVAAEHAINQAIIPIPAAGFFDPPNVDVDFNFSNVVLGGAQGNLSDLIIFVAEEEPQQAFPMAHIPAQVQITLPQYWHFATTLASFTTDITFDLSDMGFGDSANWIILRKESNGDQWIVWDNFDVLDANRIRANNVSAFSDWTIGSSEDHTLPIVLSHFDATFVLGGYMSLSWTTQSESNVNGFYVYRSQNDSYGSAILISNLISGTNTSSEQQYQFADYDVIENNTYYYWLNQQDLSGENTLYGPIMALTNPYHDPQDNPTPMLVTSISAVFPNPGRDFNIAYSLAKDNLVSINVHNLRGQKVKQLFSGRKEAGQYGIVWDGRDESGLRCSSGIYFVEMRDSSGIKDYQRILLLR